MSDAVGFSRRAVLAGPAMLSLAGAACAEEAGQSRAGNGKVLIAYLSRSGNSRIIAGTVQRALGADQERRMLNPVREWLGQIGR